MAIFSKELWGMLKGAPNVQEAVKVFTVDDNFNIDNLVEYLSKFNAQSDPAVLYTRIEAIDLSAQKDQIPMGESFAFESFANSLKIYDYIYDKRRVVLDDNDIPVLSDNIVLKSDDFRSKAGMIDAISTYLYITVGYFKPVVPSQDFNFFYRNCDILGIELPCPPHTKDYAEYLKYYADICEVIQQWQDKYELTEAEACACIYEVAPIIAGNDAETNLPKPTNVWLTGASKADVRLLEEKGMDIKTVWACNECTRKGDIVVLYAVSPHSCIHSIWRAKTDGFFNPFDYYHNRTVVSHGVKVPRISQKELEADPVFGALPMMRNKMQGLNGRELPSAAYTALLNMIARKGMDISELPVLYESKEWNPGEIKLEKDVEEKILIPVLRDLGYDDSDWTRQLELKAGRGLKAIPDFVFFPTGDKHHEVAPFVIEAKKKMMSNLQRRKDFNQGVSYAKMLMATFLGICDEERLVIYKRTKDGRFNYDEPIFERHWGEISTDVEVFAELKKLISPSVIKSYIR